MLFIIYYVKQKSAVKIPVKEATVISDSSFFYSLRVCLKKAFRKIYIKICGNDFSDTLHTGNREYFVIVHTPLSREVFWHEYAKIPRHTSQNSIAVGNLE